MSPPTTTGLYRYIVDNIDVHSESRSIGDWMSECLANSAPELSELERLELISSRLLEVQQMLIREQTRATASGIPVFEVVGEQNEFIRGFGLNRPGDSMEMTNRRERARLRDQVVAALTVLSPVRFEALWRLLVERVGGSNFLHVGRSGDEGVDFTAEFRVYQLVSNLSEHVAEDWLEATRERSIIKVIGQAKHWPGRTVQPANLRELLGTIVLHKPNTTRGERKGTLGMLVTTGRFSKETYERARRAGLILLDGEWVVSAIVNFGLGVNGSCGSLSFSQADFVSLIDCELLETT